MIYPNLLAIDALNAAIGQLELHGGADSLNVAALCRTACAALIKMNARYTDAELASIIGGVGFDKIMAG